MKSHIQKIARMKILGMFYFVEEYKVQRWQLYELQQ